MPLSPRAHAVCGQDPELEPEKEGGQEGGREGGREGGKEGERSEGGREEGRGEREGGRERLPVLICSLSPGCVRVGNKLVTLELLGVFGGRQITGLLRSSALV